MAKYPTDSTVINIYDYNNEDNEKRKNNLKLYLEKMKNLSPKVILIGEAPGFRGCRFTGIPFTSEYLLSNNLFFGNSGFETTKENDKPKKEKTATIMWEVLDSLNQYPLLWNSFPFHPHNQENPTENREPTTKECKCALDFLNYLFKLFPNINKIGAVGRKAEGLLKNNRNYEYIPHPSHCKKEHFIETLKGFFEFNLKCHQKNPTLP